MEQLKAETWVAPWVTLLGGAIAGLGPVVIKFLADRSEAARIDRLLTRTKRTVDLLSSWHKARDAVTQGRDNTDVSERIAKELDDALSRYSRIMQEVDARAARAAGLTERSRVQRVLLLYPPRAPLAWVWHILFYAFVGMIPFMILGASIGENDTPSLAALREKSGLAIAGTMFFLFFAIVFNALAWASDKATAPGRSHPS